MQISGEANGQDISTQTLMLLGGLTVTEYPLSDQVRNFNIGSSIIWSRIFKVCGWQFDDKNQANLPISTTTLNSGQKDYSLPNGSNNIALSIRQMRVSDSNSNWSVVLPITEDEIINQHGSNLDSFLTSNGLPKYYRPVANQFRLFPPSDSTVSAGLELSFDRGMIQIPYNAVTTVPGFAVEFHEALAIFAALRFAQSYPRGLADRIPSLSSDWIGYVGDPDKGITGSIARFYANRWANKNPGLRVKQENNR